MSYAENTGVPVDRSIGEINRLIERYGAEQFMYATRKEAAMIAFVANGRQIRMLLPLPDKQDPKFHTTPTGRSRKSTTASSQYEQEVRRRWRALALTIKAKLEAIETGIATFQQEFLAYTVLPSGQTVGEWAIPQINAGNMPSELPLLVELS